MSRSMIAVDASMDAWIYDTRGKIVIHHSECSLLCDWCDQGKNWWIMTTLATDCNSLEFTRLVSTAFKRSVNPASTYCVCCYRCDEWMRGNSTVLFLKHELMLNFHLSQPHWFFIICIQCAATELITPLAHTTRCSLFPLCSARTLAMVAYGIIVTGMSQVSVPAPYYVT